MQNNHQRKELIRLRLQQAFSPSHLEIIDDSAEHIGHVGSQHGAGHYTVIISNEDLINLSRIEAHRKIYAVLDDLIPQEIHALKIKIV